MVFPRYLKSLTSYPGIATGRRKSLLRFFAVTALVTCGAHFARAQSALDGFDPRANDAIHVIVVQPDGKILIAGEFTALSPNGGASVPRNHIARLNPDGTVDSAFDPNANGAVYAIALQGDGKIVVGGNFAGANSIGGQPRNYIARLDATTGAADSFNPNASLPVFAVAIQADGKILAGGLFNGPSSIGGQTRNFIARLDPASGAVDSFNPNANSYITSMVVQVDRRILVGGDFSGANSIGGQARNRIARLDSTTGMADSFDPNANSTVLALAVAADRKVIVGGDFSGPNSIGGQTRNFIARLDPNTGSADSFDPNASSLVFAVAVQADGKILAGGGFTTVGGQTRNHIARLDSVTGLADSFNPNASNTIYAIATQSDNKVLAAGAFNGANAIGGITRNYIARIERDGGVDRTLDLNLVGFYFNTMAVQADGKILIGGWFSSILGVPRNSLARLNPDGTLDLSFNPDMTGQNILVIIVQPDGKILLSGGFTSIGGQPRNYLARLDPVTGLADSFNPNVNPDTGGVSSLALQPDGKVLVAGGFTHISGLTRNRIARLDPVTGTPDSWNPNANDAIYTIAVQADGKILAGGQLTSIGGQPRNRLARLNPNTGAADSFDPNPDGYIYEIVLQPDGKIVLTGSFSTIGGQSRNRIARLDSTTGMADSFDPNPNGFLISLALQADGKILVGGSFSSIGGQPRTRFARLDGITGLADSFDPGANNNVYSIALQPDGKILAGGFFTNIGGQPRNLFARLSNDTPALQELSVGKTFLSWSLGGSSPLISRVLFESSSDNVNYNFFGDGTFYPDNNKWAVPANFAFGNNRYFRAHGLYRSEAEHGSASIAESTRKVFFAPPPTPSLVVSRKEHGPTSFDIPLPLTGVPGVECRSGGPSNSHQIIFNFPTAVTFNSVEVSVGTATISNSGGSGTDTVTINLTGVTNAQKLMVTLRGVSDGINTGDITLTMSVLLGDTNGSGTVTSADVSQAKLQSGQPLTADNFREDINASGSINASDIALVKSRVGTSPL